MSASCHLQSRAGRPCHVGLLLAAAALSATTLAPTAAATVYQWSGQGNETSFNDANNWVLYPTVTTPASDYPHLAGDGARFDIGTTISIRGQTINVNNSAATAIGTVGAVGLPTGDGDAPDFTVGGNIWLDSGSATDNATLSLDGHTNFKIGTSSTTSNIYISGSTLGLRINNMSQFGDSIIVYSRIVGADKDVTFTASANSLIELKSSSALGTTDSAGNRVKDVTLNGNGTLDLGTNTINIANFNFVGGRILLNSTSANALGGSSNTLNISGTTRHEVRIDDNRTLGVYNVVMDAGATFSVGRITETNTTRQTLTFSGGLTPTDTFTLAASGNTFDVGLLTTLAMGHRIEGGALTKSGLGDLVLMNATSTFDGLHVLSGRVLAQFNSTQLAPVGHDIQIGASGGISPLGVGGIYLGDSSNPDPLGSRNVELWVGGTEAEPANTVNFNASGIIWLYGGSTLTIANANRVNLSGGQIWFNRNANNRVVFDGETMLGGTGFTNTTLNPDIVDAVTGEVAKLTFKRKVIFGSGSSVAGSGIGLEFAPPAGTTQEVTALTSNSIIQIAGTVYFSGLGRTVLTTDIQSFATTFLSPTLKVNVSSGILQFTRNNQISGNSTITFSGDKITPGALIDVHNIDYNFAISTTLNIEAGKVGGFDFGGDAAVGTSLTLGTVNMGADSTLRFKNWQGNVWGGTAWNDPTGNPAADRVAAPGVNLDDVWFYGYNKGAVLVNGFLLAPPVNAAGTAPDFLNSTFDNRIDGDAAYPTVRDFSWHDAYNWVGDDAFGLPNAPGVTATFVSTVNGNVAYPGDLGGRTISIGATDTTVGNLIVSGGAQESNSIITFGGTGNLIFDSGANGTTATLKMTSVRLENSNSAYRVSIATPVVLNSDLLVTVNKPTNINTSVLSDLQFTNTVSGTGKVTKEGTGILLFSKANNPFSGGVVLKEGIIWAGANEALGTGTIEIGPKIGTAAIMLTTSQYSLGTNFVDRRTLTNDAILKSDVVLYGIHLAGAGKTVQLEGNPTLNTSESTAFDAVTSSYQYDYNLPVSIISSKITDSTTSGTPGGLKVIGNMYLELRNPNNDFTGGLTATNTDGSSSAGKVVTFVPADSGGQAGLVIGRAEAGHNAFGTKGITVNGGIIRVVTAAGANAEISGNGVDNSVTGMDTYTVAGALLFNGAGEVNVLNTAKISLVGSSYILFNTPETNIAGGTIDLAGSASLRFNADDIPPTTPTGTSNNGTIMAPTTPATAHITGGIINLNSTNATSDGVPAANTFLRIGAEVISTAGAAPATTVYFSTGATLYGSGQILIGANGRFILDGGVIGTSGATNNGLASLRFDTASEPATLSATAGNGVVTFEAVTKFRPGTGIVENSITELRAKSFTITAGTLEMSLPNQWLGQNGAGTGVDGANLILGGGSGATATAGYLDTKGFDNSFNALGLLGEGGSFNLGSSGKLDFVTRNDITSGTTMNWSPTALLLIQSETTTGWQTDGSGPYVRFQNEPFDITNTAHLALLNNIAFTGYESGTTVSLDGGFYYLLPSGDPTSEWTGNPGATIPFTGTDLWSDAGNWIGGVPGVGGTSNPSATIRDIDQRLSNITGRPAIVVDGQDYLLNHLNVETTTRNFTIASGLGGRLVFDGTSPRFVHKGLSTLTVSTDIVLRGAVTAVTEFNFTAARTEGRVDFTGKLTGAGGIYKIGDGDVRFYNGANDFSGGFTWSDNAGILGIYASGTTLGTGLVTFGESAAAQTKIRTNTAGFNVGTIRNLDTPGGWLLYGDLEIGLSNNLGVEGGSIAGLRINGDGTLAPGSHYIRYSRESGGSNVFIYFNGNIGGQAPDSGLNFDNPGGAYTRVSLGLNGQNTFAGGVTMHNDANNSFSLYIGSDTGLKDASGNPLPGALGYGSLKLPVSGDYHIRANDDTGVFSALLQNDVFAGGTYRRVNNRIEVPAAGNITLRLYGNLLFDRNVQDTWTLPVAARYELSLFSSEEVGVPTFGSNFEISGAGKVRVNGLNATNGNYMLRILSDKNTYTGGTELRWGTTQIGADAIPTAPGATTILSGPFGTGPVTILGAGASFPDIWQLNRFIPYSEDGSQTVRTISNQIIFGNDFRGFTVAVPTKGNTVANTLVFDDINPANAIVLPATQISKLNVLAGATLQINTRLTDNGVNGGGFAKRGPGDLVLANPANDFKGGITVADVTTLPYSSGRVIARPLNGADDVNIVRGQPGIFGQSDTNQSNYTSAPMAASSAAFDKYATNYRGTTALVTETTGAVHFGGENPFYVVNSHTPTAANLQNNTHLNYGGAFIVGGDQNGFDNGYTGSGIAYLDDGVRFTGTRADYAATSANLPGWLVVPHLIRDGSGADAEIGINLRVNNLELQNGTVKMIVADRLSGVESMTFSGGTLNLNNLDQSLLAPLVEGSPVYGRIHVTADSVLDFGQNAGNTPNLNAGDAPQRFTVGRVTIDTGVIFDATSWFYDIGGGNKAGGDPMLGLGEIRFITTGHAIGEIVNNLVLISGSKRALVTVNSDAETIFMPVTTESVWTGLADATNNRQPAIWQDYITSSDHSNWMSSDPSVPLTEIGFPGGPSNLLEPIAIDTNAGKIATFDTNTDQLNKATGAPIPGVKIDLSDLHVQIAANNTPVQGLAVAGNILVDGTNPALRRANLSIDGPGTLIMHSKGVDTAVGFSVFGANNSLTLNAPVTLHFERQGTPNSEGKYPLLAINPLSVTVDAGSIVLLNSNVIGSYASITKTGGGVLSINGNNQYLSSGIILNEGTLNLGSNDAIGGTGEPSAEPGSLGDKGFSGDGGPLVLNSGTVRTTNAVTSVTDLNSPATLPGLHDVSRSYSNPLRVGGDFTVQTGPEGGVPGADPTTFALRGTTELWANGSARLEGGGNFIIGTSGSEFATVGKTSHMPESARDFTVLGEGMVQIAAGNIGNYRPAPDSTVLGTVNFIADGENNSTWETKLLIAPRNPDGTAGIYRQLSDANIKAVQKGDVEIAYYIGSIQRGEISTESGGRIRITSTGTNTGSPATTITYSGTLTNSGVNGDGTTASEILISGDYNTFSGLVRNNAGAHFTITGANNSFTNTTPASATNAAVINSGTGSTFSVNNTSGLTTFEASVRNEAGGTFDVNGYATFTATADLSANAAPVTNTGTGSTFNVNYTGSTRFVGGVRNTDNAVFNVIGSAAFENATDIAVRNESGGVFNVGTGASGNTPAVTFSGTITNTGTGTGDAPSQFNINTPTLLTGTSVAVINSAEFNLNALTTLKTASDSGIRNTGPGVINVNTGTAGQNLHGINYTAAVPVPDSFKVGTINVNSGTTALTLTGINNASAWNIYRDAAVTAEGVRSIGANNINFIGTRTDGTAGAARGTLTLDIPYNLAEPDGQFLSANLNSANGHGVLIKNGNGSLTLTSPQSTFGRPGSLPSGEPSLIQVNPDPAALRPVAMTVGDAGVLGYTGSSTTANYAGRINVAANTTFAFSSSANQILSGGTNAVTGAGTFAHTGNSTLTIAAGTTVIPAKVNVGAGSHLEVLGTVGTLANPTAATFGASSLLSGTGTVETPDFGTFNGPAGRVAIAPGVPNVPGSPVTDSSTIATLNFGADPSSVTRFENVDYLWSLAGNAATPATLTMDSLIVTGGATWSDNLQNFLRIQVSDWETSISKELPVDTYQILHATNGILKPDGVTPYADNTFFVNVPIILNGQPLINFTTDPTGAFPDGLYAALKVYADTSGPGQGLYVVFSDIPFAVPGILYWDANPNFPAEAIWRNADDSDNNKHWRPGAHLTIDGTGLRNNNVTFKDGDMVIFSAPIMAADFEAPALDVSIRDGDPSKQVGVYGMLVEGMGSNFSYTGGKIFADSGMVNQAAEDEGFTAGEIYVRSGAHATFRNAGVTAPRLNIYANATTTLGDAAGVDSKYLIPDVFLGSLGNTGHLIFDRNYYDATGADSFAGVISGYGDVTKTGSKTVTLSADNSYYGNTTVNAGELQVTGGLGSRYTAAAVTSRNYTGDITIASGATLRFTGVDPHWQQITGRFAGAAGSKFIVDGGREVLISSDWDNTPTQYLVPGHNNFLGDLEVIGTNSGGSTDSYLSITGRLDVQTDQFDGHNPAVARAYTHSIYHGNMKIMDGGTIEFAYGRDYQVTTGALEGNTGGNFVVTSGQHFYFMGDASAYAGQTTISSDSYFHISPTAPYGASNAGNPALGAREFRVTAGSSLYGGGGAVLNASNLNMDAGSLLAATPGGFKINIAEAVMANVKIANNISVVISAGMALPRGTYSSELVSGVSGAPLATGPAAAGVAALSFANAAGNVFTGNNGVLLAGVQNVVVNAGWGVISTSTNPADWREWVLMDGIDVQSIVTSFGGDHDAAISALFPNAGEISVLGAKFQLSLNGNKLLMTQFSAATTVPEPSTYALIGGLGVLGLAFWRRRRAAKGARANVAGASRP